MHPGEKIDKTRQKATKWELLKVTHDDPYITRPETSKKAEKAVNFAPMGKLLNGNPAGNPNNAPRCGAKARTTGQPCQAPAMKNGKCRMHGGKSTGPQTEEGLKRSQYARWKHGEYSKRAIALDEDYLFIDDELIPRRALVEQREQYAAREQKRAYEQMARQSKRGRLF